MSEGPSGEGVVADAPIRGPWRSGGRVVAEMGSVFPRRCIRCGRPADDAPSRVKLWVRCPLSL